MGDVDRLIDRMVKDERLQRTSRPARAARTVPALRAPARPWVPLGRRLAHLAGRIHEILQHWHTPHHPHAVGHG